MYLIIIAWIYVVLMMAVAEATSTTGTLLGAIVTFFLYGVGPAGLVAYLMGAPSRSKAIKRREAEQAQQPMAIPTPSKQPDAGSHAAGTAESAAVLVDAAEASSRVAPVRKEP